METVVGEVNTTLVAAIRADLVSLADASKAQPMQAYMRSTMPYLGVRMPEVRRVVLGADRAVPMLTADVLLATVSRLWDEATHREHRYAATILLETRRARSLLASGELGRAGLLELTEHIIRTGAWWDHLPAAGQA